MAVDCRHSLLGGGYRAAGVDVVTEQEAKVIRSHVVAFPEGSVAIYEDGTARFFFRHMDYVYKPGQDAEDGMAKTLDANTVNAIKALFGLSYWP